MQDSEPPSYTGPPEQAHIGRQSEHLYALINSKGHKWLSLLVQSRSSSPTSLPMFFEGDVVSGRVELDLKVVETVKALTIAVQAGTTAVGQEEFSFLDINQTLWNAASEGKRTSAKLGGRHSWPFVFVLPKEVLITQTKGKEGRLYSLPPNFSERASPAYIDYRLVVTVKRGMFAVNQTLSTKFGYRPSTIPDPPSALRQLAYREASSLLGPETDPEGWKVLPPARVTGILFGAKHVDVECTLAIAKPLCYAIGSPLPLILTLASHDIQALDILSAPAAIRLYLVRAMATGVDAADEIETRRTDNFFLQGAGQASFWPSGEEDKRKRVLHGEVEVAGTLQPSFTFPRFTIRYALELLPFQAPGFVSSDAEGGRPLLTDQVMIATKQTPGILPRSHAPPGYEKAPVDDYNKSVGLLENGNQRFYHHGHY